MNHQDLDAIKKERDRLIRSACDKLKNPSDAGINPLFDRLKICDYMIRDYEAGHWKRFIWPGVFSVLIVAAILLLSWPYPVNKIHLKLKTDVVSFQLADQWKPRHGEMENVLYSQAHISHLDRIEVPGTKYKIQSDHHWIQGELTGKSFSLALSALEAGSKIKFEQHRSDLKLALKNTRINGQFYGTGRFNLNTSFVDGSIQPIEAALTGKMPKSVFFSQTRKNSSAIVFRLYPPNWESYNLPVNALGFDSFTSQQTEDPLLTSYVQEGELILPDIFKSINIKKGQRLVLKEVRGQILKLTASDHLDLEFEGKISTVSIGSGMSIQDHTPSVLEYLYHQQRLGVLLSALLGLWSALCILRQLFSR